MASDQQKSLALCLCGFIVMMAIARLGLFTHGNTSQAMARESAYVTYWTACNIHEDGGDPYDQQELREAFESQQGYWHPAVNFYNPPFLLTFVCPLTGPDLARSLLSMQCLWCLLFQLGLYFFSNLHPQRVRVLALTEACTLSCVPLLQAFAVLQSAFLVLTVVVFATALLFRGRLLLAGCMFSLCLIKPHSYAIALMLLMAFYLKRKMYRFCGGLLLGAVLQFAAVCILYGDALDEWVAIIFGNQPGAEPPRWLGTTFAGIISAAQSYLFGSYSLGWPLAVMGIGLIVACWYGIRGKGIDAIQWLQITALAPFFSAYGYFYDFGFASIAFGAVVANLPASKQRNALIAWLSFNLIAYGGLFYWIPYQHQMAWYPICASVSIVLLTVASRKVIAEQQRNFLQMS